MATQQLKIEYKGELRRISISLEESFANVKSSIGSLFGISNFALKYRDEDGDMITIDSDKELKEVLSARSGFKVARFVVVTASGESQEGEQQPNQQAHVEEKKEEVPESTPTPEPEKLLFEDVARLLSDSELVSRIQASMVSSPLLTEAVTGIAKHYLDTNGDVFATVAHAMEQLPVIEAVVGSTLGEFPELDEAWKQVKTRIEEKEEESRQQEPRVVLTPFGPRVVVRRRHCGSSPVFVRRGGCGPCRPPVDVHIGVFCDGCDNSEELKQSSLENQNRTPRFGFIRGLRFKSQKLHDFDLCASCKSSGEFEEQCGPFEEIRPAGELEQPLEKPEVKEKKQGEEVTKSDSSDTSSVTSSGSLKPVDDWVKVQEDLMTKWSPQLQQLASVGFDKSESYLGFLEEEKGDLTKVINRIIRRDAGN